MVAECLPSTDGVLGWITSSKQTNTLESNGWFRAIRFTFWAEHDYCLETVSVEFDGERSSKEASLSGGY